MKLHLPWLWVVGFVTLSAPGCADKQAETQELTVHPKAAPTVGASISSAQAVTWTHRFQRTHPTETWTSFFDRSIYTQLLDQAGCRGLRIYNATNQQGANTFVLTGVDATGDMTKGKLANLPAPNPPMHYASILLAKQSGEVHPSAASSGEPVALERARAMTHLYQANHPEQAKSYYYSAAVLRKLLAQDGCVGIRLYQALDDNKQEHLVLVGVGEDGSDLTSGALVDYEEKCPHNCDGSELIP
ncbi:hypothetical protein LGH70_18175 [Hymenobacter sp. BT635]|uniref:Lipoprotein n=1 Tax=Hymenobacter nitidus TaxID=2880929 RepID=A0ABS8AGE9_9BACT|nr:hypothetical protein [Hymenobacter nitidus]MCB2379530.1 hypothetical protein [Hymenobacter nitidus]